MECSGQGFVHNVILDFGLQVDLDSTKYVVPLESRRFRNIDDVTRVDKLYQYWYTLVARI
jgi:hypothetical protein